MTGGGMARRGKCRRHPDCIHGGLGPCAGLQHHARFHDDNRHGRHHRQYHNREIGRQNHGHQRSAGKPRLGIGGARNHALRGRQHHFALRPSSGAAVQDGYGTTVAAASDITVTGNILYKTEPVTTTRNQIPSTPADTLIPGNNNGQVLGIFTAGGNVNLNVPTSGQNLEIDASIATISN